HAITAVYGGNANYYGSSAGVLTQIVCSTAATPTTISLASSAANPSTYGDRVTLTATVSQAAAPGTVTFKDGATTLATSAVSGGVATYATGTLPAGLHNLTAVYGGDTNYFGSSSANYPHTVNPKTVTLSGITAVNKVYDGTLVASLIIPAITPAAVITPLDASATSWQSSSYPSNTINGSGMNRSAGDARILDWP
ncbi:MAG: Ig-like domain-containing protein, partial [bacterium]|nr:Ig-like domain-containing protein [bacterium]